MFGTTKHQTDRVKRETSTYKNIGNEMNTIYLSSYSLDPSKMERQKTFPNLTLIPFAPKKLNTTTSFHHS